MARTFGRVLLGVLAFALACEVLLRGLPVSSSTETGYHFDDMILTYPARHEWQVATGWDLRNAQRMRSNNVGFASYRDFVFDPNAVALIGDSFVEASMLPAADRPGPQLERALGQRQAVYAMGGPGSSLLDYAERIRFASERFGVRDVVLLLERGDIRQALCGSGNVQAACLDPKTLSARTQKQPPPSLVKKLLRHSALAHYLFSQLKITPQGLWRQAFAPPSLKQADDTLPRTSTPTAGSLDKPSPELDVVTHTFFEQIRPYRAGRLVVVIDSDRAGLRTGRAKHDPDRVRFMVLAR